METSAASVSKNLPVILPLGLECNMQCVLDWPYTQSSGCAATPPSWPRTQTEYRPPHSVQNTFRTWGLHGLVQVLNCTQHLLAPFQDGHRIQQGSWTSWRRHCMCASWTGPVLVWLSLRLSMCWI